MSRRPALTSADGASASLFWRVFAVNAGLARRDRAPAAVSPVEINAPIKPTQALIVVGGLVITVAANALLLRRAVAPLERLAQRMETVDLLRPGPAPAGRPQRRGRPRRRRLQPHARPARERAPAERPARARRPGGRAGRHRPRPARRGRPAADRRAAAARLDRRARARAPRRDRRGQAGRPPRARRGTSDLERAAARRCSSTSASSAR